MLLQLISLAAMLDTIHFSVLSFTLHCSTLLLNKKIRKKTIHRRHIPLPDLHHFGGILHRGKDTSLTILISIGNCKGLGGLMGFCFIAA